MSNPITVPSPPTDPLFRTDSHVTIFFEKGAQPVVLQGKFDGELQGGWINLQNVLCFAYDILHISG